MQSMAIPGFILHDRVIGGRKFFDVSFSSQPYNFEVATILSQARPLYRVKLPPVVIVLLECLEIMGAEKIATTALLLPHAVQLICDCDWRLSCRRRDLCRRSGRPVSGLCAPCALQLVRALSGRQHR